MSPWAFLMYESNASPESKNWITAGRLFVTDASIKSLRVRIWAIAKCVFDLYIVLNRVVAWIDLTTFCYKLWCICS